MLITYPEGYEFESGTPLLCPLCRDLIYMCSCPPSSEIGTFECIVGKNVRRLPKYLYTSQGVELRYVNGPYDKGAECTTIEQAYGSGYQMLAAPLPFTNKYGFSYSYI